MNWFILGIIIVFFTVAILTSDYWLDKFFGSQPTNEWDETARWNDMRQALEPELEREMGGTDYLNYYDFRRKREDQA